MKNFAFIHVERLRDMGRGQKATRQYKPRSYTRHWGVEGCWEHDMRLIETANADPERFSKNTIVCEETDWEAEELSSETISRTKCDKADFISKKVQDFIEKHHTGDKLRDNAVRACMLLSAVSPQFLRDMKTPGWNEYLNDTSASKLKPLNEAKVNLWKKSTIKYYRKKYGDRIMCIMFHDDELNPHCTVYIVPLVEKRVKTRGRDSHDSEWERKTRVVKTLCAKEIFTPDRKTWTKAKTLDDGTKIRGFWTVHERGTCSLMQDEYADFLKSEGLEVRRGNRRLHNQPALDNETNRERYERSLAAINEIKALPDIELRPYLEAKAADMADADRLRIERDHHQIIAAGNQEMVGNLENKITESLREVPVANAISKLTGLDPFEPDEGGPPVSPTPPKKKRTDIQLEFVMPNGQRIGIKADNRFENLTPEIPFVGKNATRFRGDGAIDAVIYITGWNFQEAFDWLVDQFGPEMAGRTVAKKYAALTLSRDGDERVMRKNHAENVIRDLETPDEDKWPAAMQSLTKTFRFRIDPITNQHEDNWIDANKFGHLVFLKARWDEANDLVPTGKIIVDLKNPTVTLKETGDNGMYMNFDRDAKKVIICSSPMDALAIRSNPNHYTDTVMVIGNNPTDATKKALAKVVKMYKGKALLAENLTAAGRKLANWLSNAFPDIQKLPLPEGFQNWLEHHRRPRIKSDPADLRIVQFPEQSMTGPDEIAME